MSSETAILLWFTTGAAKQILSRNKVVNCNDTCTCDAGSNDTKQEVIHFLSLALASPIPYYIMYLVTNNNVKYPKI